MRAALQPKMGGTTSIELVPARIAVTGFLFLLFLYDAPIRRQWKGWVFYGRQDY
jgi:hypothetical protein